MSILQDRIESATPYILTYFEDFRNAHSGFPQISCQESLENSLKNLGVTDSEIGIELLDSEFFTFELFRDSLDIKLPIARLQLCFSKLKAASQKKQDVSNLETLVSSLKPVGQWSDLELLDKYSKNCSFDIEEELKKRTKNNPCIIFDSSNQVDVEKSLYLVRMARHQVTPATFKIKEEIYQVFRVGEFPLDVFYECPFHKNTLLVNGYCESCGHEWDTKDYDKNVFFRLISQNENVDIRLYRSKSFNELKSFFPKVFLKYQELKETGDLPSLKCKLSKSQSGDPFRISSNHRTY